MVPSKAGMCVLCAYFLLECLLQHLISWKILLVLVLSTGLYCSLFLGCVFAVSVHTSTHTHTHTHTHTQFGILITIAFGMFMSCGIWSLVKEDGLNSQLEQHLNRTAGMYETVEAYQRVWDYMHDQVKLGTVN